MLIDTMPLKNFLSDLRHIREPMPRFRIAQLLFIWSLTFAWIKEGFMRAAAGLALLLMWNTIPLPHFSLNEKDFSRTTFFLVLAFFLWIFTIPAIFGVASVAQELQSFLKPLEVLIFILLSLFFFRGENFEDRFAFWSVVGLSVFIFSCAVNRYTHNFNDTRGLTEFFNFVPMAASQYMAMWLGCLVYYIFCKKTSRIISIVAFCALSLVMPLSLVTYCRGSVAIIVSAIFFAIIFAFLLIRRSVVAKIAVIVCMITFNFFVGFLIYSCVNLDESVAIWDSRLQSRMMDTDGKAISLGNLWIKWQGMDTESVTTGRMSAWRQTITKIQEKPISGYGLGKSFKTFNIQSDRAKEAHSGEIITHPHNTMLQVAVHTGLPGLTLFILSQLSLFFLAISKTVASKRQTLYFIFAMMVVAKFFSGVTDAYFMPARYFLAPFCCLAFYVMLNDSQKENPVAI